ncbi:MAG: zeta toxin family protein [Planctomycetes bacterium]|nr:zeta toxin family protein [Planctomycetota bacterium]
MDAQPTPRPQVAVLAGINGAGKSSSADSVLRVGMGMPVFVNPDTVARGLNAFDPESEAVKAGRVVLEHLRELAARRRSFAFETTLAGRTYADWLRGLCSNGYAAHLFYFWLRSPELAIERVALRVRSGGHHIPEDTVRRRYSRSVRNFLELFRPVVTTWQVYDNSNGRPRLIAFNNSYFDTVLDHELWARFNRSADDVRTGDTPSG